MNEAMVAARELGKLDELDNAVNDVLVDHPDGELDEEGKVLQVFKDDMTDEQALRIDRELTRLFHNPEAPNGDPVFGYPIFNTSTADALGVPIPPEEAEARKKHPLPEAPYKILNNKDDKFAPGWE